MIAGVLAKNSLNGFATAIARQLGPDSLFGQSLGSRRFPPDHGAPPSPPATPSATSALVIMPSGMGFASG
jgi:hypothetical protein